jgi:hypothetical protein
MKGATIDHSYDVLVKLSHFLLGVPAKKLNHNNYPVAMLYFCPRLTKLLAEASIQ